MLVSVSNVVKRFPKSRVAALNGISFEIGEGEFVAILGPSGSGKTTALRCIAGLESVTEGEIRIADKVVSTSKDSIPPSERNIGMVFQSYALWPHMTVFDNVAYALKVQHLSSQDIKSRVQDMLDLLGLPEKVQSYPHELSGGQQQRVALARALVAQPSLILFDEPLSNLDARLRDAMRVLIRDLTKRLGVAGIYVTHDRLDALVMAERVIVMDAGIVIQEGAPIDLYTRPRNSFVAQFLGDVNVYQGAVGSVDGDLVTVDLGGGLQLTGLANGSLQLAVGDQVRVGIRPSQVRPTDAASDGANHLQGTLERATFLGEIWRYRAALTAGAQPISLEFLSMDPASQGLGQPIDLSIAFHDVILLPAESIHDLADE